MSDEVKVKCGCKCQCRNFSGAKRHKSKFLDLDQEWPDSTLLSMVVSLVSRDGSEPNKSIEAESCM